MNNCFGNVCIITPPLYSMNKIPVTFTHEGKEYSGTLDQVQGVGATSVYHLMIDRFYWGRLRRYNESWVFDPTPKDEWLKGFADYFGECVEKSKK